MTNNIEMAVKELKSGGLVAIPTETVYGLAAPIDQPAAIKSIFKSKERPLFDPLIVHVAGPEQAKALVPGWWPILDVLCEKFWPGPLTLVLEKTEEVSPLITSGLDTVGLRCPDHPLTLQLLKEVGPVAAPSANRFGRTSPTCAEHVLAELPEVMVLDGGECAVGIESTIVSVQKLLDEDKFHIKILRPGVIGEPEFIEALGDQFNVQYFTNLDEGIAPGQLQNHYQPTQPLVLVGSELPQNLVEQVNEKLGKNFSSYNLLKLDSDGRVAARQLYGELHRLSEKEGFIVLSVKESLWQESSAWAAIGNRLEKASSLDLRSQ